MPARTGLFGKLPAHGDFVRRNLPRSFVAPWDAWLSAGLLARPGAPWTAWRFFLLPGAFGPDPVAGIVAPSADAVGRRFPLTLAAPGVADPPGEDWYVALEALAAQHPEADALADALPDPTPGDGSGDGAGFWTADGRVAGAEAGFAALLDP